MAVTNGRTFFYDAEDRARVVAELDNIFVLRFAPDGRVSEFREWDKGRPDHEWR